MIARLLSTVLALHVMVRRLEAEPESEPEDDVDGDRWYAQIVRLPSGREVLVRRNKTFEISGLWTWLVARYFRHRTKQVLPILQ